MVEQRAIGIQFDVAGVQVVIKPIANLFIGHVVRFSADPMQASNATAASVHGNDFQVLAGFGVRSREAYFQVGQIKHFFSARGALRLKGSQLAHTLVAAVVNV